VSARFHRRARPALALCLLLALTPASRVAGAEIGGPFELVDQHGAIRTDADYRGSYLLIYFGYTYCADLCPTTLLKMGDAIDELARVAPGKAGRVLPLLITVDPARDTPEVLRRYVADFHPRMVGLTGTPKALAAAGRRYGVRAARSLLDPALVDHTGFVYLMGPDGKYLEHFESDAGSADLVAALQRHVTAPPAGAS
jgi:protein SCO1/2